jgi:hypothetical protein
LIHTLWDPANPARRVVRDEQGFSLMEAIVATVIATIAIVGFAYSIGMGRGFINGYEAARAADALAAACMDSLSTTGADLSVGGPRPITPLPLVYNAQTIGGASWRVTQPAAGVPGRSAMVQATVTVAWALGGHADSVQYSRYFPAVTP